MQQRWVRVLVACLCGLVLVGGVSSWAEESAAAAGIRYVGVGRDCRGQQPCYASIQEAVDAAQSGDEIRIAAGTYTGVHVRPRRDITTTGNVTQVVYLEKEVTLRGGYSADFSVWDPKQYPTTLDAQQQGRVVYITGAISPVIEGVRLVHGKTEGSSGEIGGGLYAITAAVTLRNATVYSNYATRGGGIGIEHGKAILSANEIIDNAGTEGIGAYLTATEATVTENAFLSNEGIRCGGLYAFEGDTRLSRNVISGNKVALSQTAWKSFGGGLCLWGGEGTVVDNSIVSNTAEVGGGAILVQGVFTLTGNTVHANRAETGGGLYLLDQATLIGNDVRYNVADPGVGGGIALESASAVLRGNTVVSNTALSSGGGGILAISSHFSSERNLIASNTAKDGAGLLVFWNSTAFLDSDAIISNVATHAGGGLCLNSPNLALTCTNVLVAENEALEQGDGIYYDSYDEEPITLIHTTLVNNGGEDGEGIFVEAHSSATVVLTNSIIAGHGVGISATAGSRVQLESTLWGSGAWANGLDWGGAGEIITGTPEHNLWGDPGFMDPVAGNYHLRRDSIAIDRGIDAGVLHDMDGQRRPLEGGYDLGADEFPPYWHYFPMVRRE